MVTMATQPMVLQMTVKDVLVLQNSTPTSKSSRNMHVLETPSQIKQALGILTPSQNKQALGILTPSQIKQALGILTPSQNKQALEILTPSQIKQALETLFMFRIYNVQQM